MTSTASGHPSNRAVLRPANRNGRASVVSPHTGKAVLISMVKKGVDLEGLLKGAATSAPQGVSNEPLFPLTPSIYFLFLCLSLSLCMHIHTRGMMTDQLAGAVSRSESD